ncbi:MAG: AccI family restriction endonuclease, partial [Bacteroidetes bacterium]
MHPFERKLEVSEEDIEFYFKGFDKIGWLNFWLNPRRLRGSDFLMRWSQGVWSEKRISAAINKTEKYFATAYGPSSTAPTNDVRAFELYFERLEAAGLGKLKRPDLLIYGKKDEKRVLQITENFGGEDELPFVKEEDLSELLDMAVCAIECENSLWVAEKMPAYGERLRPMRRLGGKLGLPKSAVLPTVILKEEDRGRLLAWEDKNKVPVHLWHVFFDRAYGLSLREAQRLIDEQLILPHEQVFQAPGGATTRKAIYKFYYHYAYNLGVALERPVLEPKYIEDKNGHILPYVH